MSRVVVTGGAGFIGSHLVGKLIERGDRVIVIDDLSSGSQKNINPKAEFYRSNISEISSLFYSNIDVVYHLAAKARVAPSFIQPLQYHRANVDGTLAILNVAKRAGVRRFVFASSSAVYGQAETLPTSEHTPLHPSSPYGLQKQMGEQYCQLYREHFGLDTVCLRYFNVCGGRMEIGEGLMMAIFYEQRQKQQPLTIVGDGEQRRDFVHIDDVVSATIKAGDYVGEELPPILNIGSGENLSVNQIVEIFGGEKTYLPDRLEPAETLADITLADAILNWKPTIRVKNWLADWVNNNLSIK